MKPLPRMTSVEPVIFGVLKIAWNDGYEGVVDLRPVIAKGPIFEFIRDTGDSILHATAVGFQLGFTVTAHTDAAFLAG